MTGLIPYLPLAVAIAIGLALGLERELAQKPAGLRTQLLVTVGTTLFVLAGRRLGGDGSERIAANVATGLGFLGAGVILTRTGPSASNGAATTSRCGSASATRPRVIGSSSRACAACPI